jgi:signal transduction histidine kinase
LQQIAVNLVNNAVKFTDDGSINIRLYSPDPKHWCIEVKDTGRGIPPDAINNVFEAFEQADTGITREHKGVGLGLTIVKRLSTLMNGEVTVSSNLGTGSIFTVTLPLILATVEEKI